MEIAQANLPGLPRESKMTLIRLHNLVHCDLCKGTEILEKIVTFYKLYLRFEIY